MKNFINITEDTLIVLGISVSLPQIESLLGIIILAVQIVLLSVKGIMKAIHHFKKGDIDSAINEVTETTKTVTDMINNSDKKDN